MARKPRAPVRPTKSTQGVKPRGTKLKRRGPARTRGREAERTAFHEAGHAVVALALGRRVEKITITPHRVYAGRCWVSGFGAALGKGRRASPSKTQRTRDNIVVLFGGLAAEERFDPKSDPDLSQADFMQAMKLALHDVGRSTARRAAYLQVHRLVAEQVIAQHWVLVKLLAEAVLVRRELLAQDIETLLHSAPGLLDRMNGPSNSSRRKPRA